MPGQHLKGKICGQAIRRDMVDEIKFCSESNESKLTEMLLYIYMMVIYSQPIKSSQQKFMLYLS